MNKLMLWVVCWFTMALHSTAQAAKQVAGIGAVAENMMQPVALVSNFVFSACMIIGASFFFASIIKYFEHRRSPLMVPIGKVLFLLFAGIFLMMLPFTHLLIQAGAPHLLMKQS